MPLPEPLLAFGTTHIPADERRAAGKQLRRTTPRTSHSGWEPAADRPDPVEVLVESNRTRVKELVPLRYSRMAASPFAFLRGAAQGMALDLATTPVSGPQVQLCGDAHIANFGVFASPERKLMFDLNDFDETWRGPFEWDVKRMAASIAVAALDVGADHATARRMVINATQNYCEWTDHYSQMTHLDVWYAHIEVDELMASMRPDGRRSAAGVVRKAQSKNNLMALSRLTELVDGQRRIVSAPPLVERFEGEQVRARVEAVFAEYRSTLAADRTALFDSYRFVDFARKVVGVGSVGTRCWIALFQGPNGGPLFLQLKEARSAAPQLALADPEPLHHGQRVVEGQRMLQATSDVMLGWGTDRATGNDYFVRQMWDAKGAVDVANLTPGTFDDYGRTCAWALARAHARTSDSVTISGYLGVSARFPEAIADFAVSYAEQTRRDHAALVDAISLGVLSAA